MMIVPSPESNVARAPGDHRPTNDGASGCAAFGCGVGYEELAAELAALVSGTWSITPGVSTVMIMANGATVPSKLPGQPSQRAQDWWHAAVTTRLALRPFRTRGAATPVVRTAH